MALHCEAGAFEAYLSERLGEGLIWEDQSPEGSSHRRWRVRGPRGVLRVWAFGSHRAWRQALQGQAALGRALRARGVIAPRVLAADREGARLLMTEVDGAPVRTTAEASWFRQAGQAVARIQRVAVGRIEPVGLADEVRQRAARWIEAGRGRIPDDRLEAVARRVQQGAAFEGVARVWAHRRVEPASWRITPEGLGWVHFQHSRPDAPETDLIRVIATCPPAAARAFLQGWGGALDERARARIEALAAIFALRQAVRGPAEASAGAHALLQRLATGDPLGLDRLG